MTLCFRIRKINEFQLQKNTKGHLPCEALQPSRTASGFQRTPLLTFCPSFSQRGDEALRVKVTCPSRMRLTRGCSRPLIPPLSVYYLLLPPPAKYECVCVVGVQGQGWMWGLSACDQIGIS